MRFLNNRWLVAGGLLDLVGLGLVVWSLPEGGWPLAAGVGCLLAGALAISRAGFGLGEAPDTGTRLSIRDAAKLLAAAGVHIDRRENPPFEADESAPIELYYKVRCLTEFSRRSAGERHRSPVIEAWTEPARMASAVDRTSGDRVWDGRDLIRLSQEKTEHLKKQTGWQEPQLPFE